MNVYRRAAVNGGALLFLIILIVLTIIFTVFLIVKAQDSQAVLQGDPEHAKFKPSNCLVTLRSEVDDKRKDIEELENERELVLEYIHHLDAELIAYESYYDDLHDEWIAVSCGTPNAGPDDKVARGPWHLLVHKVKATRDYLQGEKRIEQSMADRGYPQLEELRDNFSRQGTEILQKVTRQEEQWNRDREALRDQLDQYDIEKDKLEEKHRVERSSRQIAISQLESQIRELLELRLRWLTDIEPDGKIIRADVEHTYMIINRGSADGIFKGLKFQVFQYVKGQIVDKGMIEVTRVSPTCATCIVLQEADARDNPMIRGDLIGNPIFDPRQPKTFYLAGDFERFNKDDLAAFIERMGGRAVQELVPSTHFIVAGKNSEEKQDAAREYQVLAMTEEMLVKFLTTRFGPLSPEEREARIQREAESRSAEESRREMERSLEGE